ncbi:hypothetical protein [Pendulispora albinea]|uniref:Uncharacterized protein n=1 Tax=Pendulispora albinea TaxID=2741071 RepID=A0ABZ2M4L7_9BACT
MSTWARQVSFIDGRFNDALSTKNTEGNCKTILTLPGRSEDELKGEIEWNQDWSFGMGRLTSPGCVIPFQYVLHRPAAPPPPPPATKCVPQKGRAYYDVTSNALPDQDAGVYCMPYRNTLVSFVDGRLEDAYFASSNSGDNCTTREVSTMSTNEWAEISWNDDWSQGTGRSYYNGCMYTLEYKLRR